MRDLRSLLSRPALRLGWTLLLFAVLAVLLPLPHFGGWHTVSNGLDWGLFQFYAELNRQTILEHGQFPLWNPYFCGGTVQLANPQTLVVSPWTLVSLLVGTQPMLRLHTVTMLFIAMASMLAWARYRGQDHLFAVASALAFGMSGFFAARIGWGYQSYYSFAYLPLIMMSYEHGRRTLWAAVPLGALVALMFYEGGAYPLPMTAFMLLLRALVDMVREPRRAHRVLLLGLCAGAVALGLAAPKALTVMDYLIAHPRVIRSRDAMLLSQLFEMFLGRVTAKKAAGYVFNRYEYNNYLGPVVMAAVAWGLWQSRREPYRPIFIHVGLIVLILIGHHGTWAPFTLMSELPILSGMRNPSRYTVFVGMYFCLVFGYVLAELSTWLAARWPRLKLALPVLLVAVVVGDAFSVHQGHWPHNAFVNPPIARVKQPFRWSKGGGNLQYASLLRNVGSLGCYEGIHIPASRAIRVDTDEFAWLADASAGRVQLESWSPNRHVLRASLLKRGRVLVNQNNLGDWRVDGVDGAVVVNQQGLLAVDLPPGEHRFELRYAPRLFRTGLIMTTSTPLVLAGIWGVGRWRRRRRQGGGAETAVPDPQHPSEADAQGVEGGEVRSSE